MHGVTKKKLLDKYRELAPDKIAIEDSDGTEYPKDIEVPEFDMGSIATLLYDLIPDKKKMPRPWYELPRVIQEAREESYCCYYNGLYLSSILCSITAIELSVKLACISRKGNPIVLTNENVGLGSMLNALKTIGLGAYEDKIAVINDARIGILHYNHRSMGKAAERSGADEPDLIDPWIISKFASLAYRLMNEITEKTADIIVKEHEKRQK